MYDPERKKRIRTLVIISILLIGIFGTGLLFFRQHFHHELMDETIDFVWLEIEDLEDTNLTITFSNSTSLCYSIDIVTYEGIFHYGRFHRQSSAEGSTHVRIVPDVRIREMNITLRDDTRYNLDIAGQNLNSLVIFSNNASLESNLWYTATGNISIILDETCFSAETSYSVIDVVSDIITVYVDLPSGVEGRISCLRYIPRNEISISGWVYNGVGVYSTFGSGDPEKWINFILHASEQYIFWLST